MIQLLSNYAPALARGLTITLELAAVVWVVGISGGVVLGALGARWSGLNIGIRLFAVLFAAVPALVVLTWLHYPAQALLGIVVDPFITTALALTVLNVIFVADLVSQAVRKLPRDLENVALMSGLNPRETFSKITFPIAVRQLIPPILLLQVTMLHATLFGSLISVPELFRTIQTINAVEYKPVELYTLLAGFYLAVSLPLQLLAYALSRRVRHEVVT